MIFVLPTPRGSSLLCEEDEQIVVERRSIRRKRNGLVELLGELDVIGATPTQPLSDVGPGIDRQSAFEHFGLDRGQRLTLFEVEPAAQSLHARFACGLAEPGAVFEQFPDQLVKVLSIRLARDVTRRLQQAAALAQGAGQRLAPCARKEFAALEIVQHAETRWRIRLERKAMQKSLTEGVDGLYLQAAWRLDGARKKLSREVARRGVERRTCERSDLQVKRGVVENGPIGEQRVNARRHIRRGRLRVGEAENARGRNAFEQQPHDALRQNMRLSRARMRRDPGGKLGVGRARLRLLRRQRNGRRLMSRLRRRATIP